MRRSVPDTPAGGPTRRRVRYVPLVLLMIASALAASVGVVANARLETDEASAAAEAASPAPVAPATEGTGSSLPEVCHQPVDAAAAEPWITDPAGSEAIWTSHAADFANAYIEGQDGWIYWGDIQNNNISQAVGRRLLTQAELDQWIDYLTRLRDGLEEEGIPLYVVIAPAKWEIYPQNLPQWMVDLQGSGPFDQLLASGTDLPIVDIRQPLVTASEEAQTFSRYNSHWTDYGAYAAWQAVAECLAATMPDAASQVAAPALSAVVIGNDHNEFEPFGFDVEVHDWTVPEYEHPLAPVDWISGDGTRQTDRQNEQVGLEQLPMQTETHGAQSALTALVMRDSFGSGLSVPLEQSFQHTWQVRHMFDYPPEEQNDLLDTARRYRPDVVILEVAQRHLNQPPIVPASWR